MKSLRLEKTMLMLDEWCTNDGCQAIAIGHLSDSGDLKIKIKFNILIEPPCDLFNTYNR